MIILPGDYEYQETLNNPSLFMQFRHELTGDYSWIKNIENGMVEPVSYKRLQEYLNGGEYDVAIEDNEEDELEEYSYVDTCW
ncbi:hypothetical protein CAL7716_043850 [Calothrix sp. PCC 7716]|nr:hypothetical protein CAL7716_043850 [Calothrix sp. PCC 7716]